MNARSGLKDVLPMLRPLVPHVRNLEVKVLLPAEEFLAVSTLACDCLWAGYGKAWGLWLITHLDSDLCSKRWHCRAEKMASDTKHARAVFVEVPSGRGGRAVSRAGLCS